MSTAMTLFTQPNAGLPAHLAEAFEGKDNVLPRETTPALTFRGKVWRMRQGGEEIVLTRQTDEGTMPVPAVQVVILNLNPKRSRVMYAGAYVSGQNASPVCWSSDGEKPDPDVKAPFAKTCAACPNSAKGSKITPQGKETTACAQVKRLAVVPASKLDMEPMLLKVPQTSIWDKNNQANEAEGWFAFDQYVDFLRQRGVKHTAAVVTKIKFDSAAEYPKLLFTATRWLEPAEVASVLPMVDAEGTKKLLVGKINEGGDEPAESHEAAAPAQAAAPAAPPAPPAASADDDDGFGTPAAAPAATPAPAPVPAAPKAPKAPKAATPKPAAPAPAAPPPPPAVAPAGGNADLAALAAAWDD